MRLSDKEFKNEVEQIIQFGYRVIEFVYATDNYFSPMKICERIRIAKQIGLKYDLKLKIGLNADAISYDGYSLLQESGLDFFVLWMETYNEVVYKKVHPRNTFKADFNNRLNAYESAIKAGLTKYGIGVLWGLSNWEDDLEALIKHGCFLENKYGHAPYIVGVPRLKSGLNTNLGLFDQLIDDETYKYICKEIKRAFPNTMLFLNTRESLKLNLELLNGGNELFTIDCKTFPGAYLNKTVFVSEQEQFKTERYDRDYAIKAIRQKGYIPKFDW